MDRLEAQLIDHIFEFGNKTLEDLMTPRSDTFFLSVSTPLAVAVAEIKRTWRTKVPVVAEHRDDIVGILHARDLLGVDLEQADRENRPLEKLVREPYFVPESKPATELFHSFRDRKLSLALVVDEFGGATGLVTIEDIMEEVVEDIEDEYDSKEKPTQWIRKLSEREYLVSARIEIDILEEKLGIRLPEGNYVTLAGFLLGKAREVPAAGAVINIEEVTFMVERATPQAIQEVRVRLS